LLGPEALPFVFEDVIAGPLLDRFAAGGVFHADDFALALEIEIDGLVLGKD
jgi:hypothetical protein